MEEQFKLSKKHRNLLLAVAGTGLVGSLLGIFLMNTEASRIWANILLNNQFVLGISLGAAFFIAVHRIALSGWHTAIQNVPHAMTSFLPFAFLLMLVLYFGMNDIYKWSQVDGLDPVADTKKPWLNVPFFFVRVIIYFAGWIALVWLMRKNTFALIDSSDIRFNTRRKIYAGLFLTFYGITVSTSSWDWIMSLDPHWDSTIFGWYVFMGMFVTALTVIILITWFLKRRGYLKFLRKEHVHDLAVLLFSFSIFWTYLWFSQFLLIWYGHIPQETSYFIPRLKEFRPFFFINLGVNFLVPFFGLIRVSSKQQLNWVALIAAIVLAGHWIDYWLMIMPSAIGDKAVIGLIEIFMTVLYGSVFLLIVFKSLARYPLLVKNDPFLDESMNYDS
jgi:hypothetical protein